MSEQDQTPEDEWVTLFAPIPPQELAGFAARLAGHLQESPATDDLEFEGVEVEDLMMDVQAVVLARYRGRRDPDMPQDAGEYGVPPYTPTYELLRERRAEVRDALVQAWGEPAPYEIGGDVPAGAVEESLGWGLKRFRLREAEVWARDGWAYALASGWEGLDAAGYGVQILFLSPASVPAAPPREVLLEASNGASLTVYAPLLADLGRDAAEFIDRHAEDGPLRLTELDTGASLTVDDGGSLASRTRGGAETQYTALRTPGRADTLAEWFVRFGDERLGAAGAWHPGRPEGLGGPETSAGTATGAGAGAQPGEDVERLDGDAAREALARLGDHWETGGADDPSGRFCILLEGRGIDEKQGIRAEVLRDLAGLGLERVTPREPGPDGEVWVLYDERLRAEIERHI